MDNNNMLSRIETSELLKVTKMTLWNWEKQGILIPCYRDIGGHVFYDPQDIKKLLLKKEQEGRRIL